MGANEEQPDLADMVKRVRDEAAAYRKVVDGFVQPWESQNVEPLMTCSGDPSYHSGMSPSCPFRNVAR